MINVQQIADRIQCYFFGESFGTDKLDASSGITGYALPDFGVVFRRQFNGNLIECQYAGLLELLRFIDLNRKNFLGKHFEILSDSAVVIYQVNQKKLIGKDLLPYFRSVEIYKNKFPFKLSWIPKEDNIAVTGLLDMPPINIEAEFNIIFDKNEPKQDNSLI
jgi:hypothetical protein